MSPLELFFIIFSGVLLAEIGAALLLGAIIPEEDQ